MYFLLQLKRAVKTCMEFAVEVSKCTCFIVKISNYWDYPPNTGLNVFSMNTNEPFFLTKWSCGIVHCKTFEYTIVLPQC